MRPMGIVELKTTGTGFTFVPLMAIGTESFTSNLVLVATVAARNSDGYHTIKTKSPYLGHDRNVIQGDLPRRQIRLVQAWVELHREELTENYNLLREEVGSFKKIKPLM